MKVKVYRNLNRKDVCYSLLAVAGPHKGLVLGYTHSILLANPEFIISELGRQRVINQQRKNVHAFIVGDVVGINWFQPRRDRMHIANFHEMEDWFKLHSLGTPITYNPYKHGSFIEKDTGQPVSNNNQFVSIIGKDVRVIGYEEFGLRTYA